MLPCRDVGGEAGEAFPLELAQRNGSLARELVARRHDEHELLLPAGDGPETGPCLGVGDQSQIGAAILDSIVDFICLAVVDGHFDARMILAELFEKRWKIVERDADDACHAECAAEFAACDAEAGVEAVIARQDVAADLEVDATLGGEGEAVIAPVDERNTKAFLDRADLLADRALCDAAGLRCPGKVPGVAEVAEDLEALDVHNAESALVDREIPRGNRAARQVSAILLMPTITENLEAVRSRIDAAAVRAGRSPGEVELVAISKTHPAESVREAADAGQELFGENRVQEALVKIPLLPSRLRWHLIGHLQANKVRKALPLFELIHGVDTMEIARNIDRIAADLGLFPRILLEVNVSGEGSKHGFSPENLERELEGLLALPRVQVEGFMTMAPLAQDPESARPYFAALRELRDRMAQQSGIPLGTLSMGMSGDYQVAVEEGATLVRVGSAIFGSR